MKRYYYGKHADQFGDLYRAESSNTLPVLMVIHGGYWKDNHSLNSYATKAIVDHYSTDGNVAIWNLEYRRMEFEGLNKNAPWPAILKDVADGLDFLRQIAETENLDLSRILVLGHSAGGHLSSWIASRANIPQHSELYSAEALIPVRAVVLAGILDLSTYNFLSQPMQVERFIGGKKDEFPDRYATADPLRLRDKNIHLTIIHGIEDAVVPVAQARNFVDRNKGENIHYKELSECDHFGMLPLDDIVPKHWKTLIQVLDRELRILSKNI